MPSSIELADKVHLLEREISKKDQRIRLLEEYIRLHNSKVFGASSEKGSGRQGQLFNEAESEIDAGEDVASEEISVPAHTRKKKKRASIPDGLPVEEVMYDLPESEKTCRTTVRR